MSGARSRLRHLTAIASLCAAVAAPAGAACIQNPGFDSPTGWELTSGGPSGTARILGGFLELSVLFTADFAQARQLCTSTATQRTVEVDVSDFGIGTVHFEIGWQNQAGTAGDYVEIRQAGVAAATTRNPEFTYVVFRADGNPDRLGPSAQALDNVRVTESNPPTPAQLVDHLLGKVTEPDDADVNGDGVVDVADLISLLLPPNP